MTKRILIAVAGATLCCNALAGGLTTHDVRVALGTNSSASATLTARGFVEEIYTDAPGAGQTGTVAVSYQPLLSSMAAVNLATNIVTADTVWRPRVDGTGIDAAALTSDPPGRYLLYGETVTVSISDASTTGATWRVIIKTNEEN